ncbi:FtsX-like permease family protein [Agrilactobacillus yilanensis]|uniref:FtsX-like permease family protein n=1 Tax=Agrilactobacillus yilanensis TaxID=2485997 RepID=A0ABW4J9U2_9LACO|nr:FtsX-like permease family protein [Agrilactobacillus yilanensis]
MLYDLAIKNIKQNYLLHSIHIVITALAVLVYFDFSLMAADHKLIRLYQDVLPADQMLTFFSIVVAVLLIVFSIYWNRLLLKQRYQDIGLLQLMGGKISKIVLSISLEILISELIAFGIGILLGLLFYKLLAMILLKISVFKLNIGFFYATKPLLLTLALIPILQIIIFLNNLITIKRHSLIKLLKKKDSNRYSPVPQNRAYLLGVLVIGLMVAAVVMTQHVFRLTYELSWLLHLPESFSFLLVFLIIVGIWTVGMYGLFRIVWPLIFKLIGQNKRFYFKDTHMFTLAELRSWFIQNYRSLAVMSLLMGVAFSMIGIGTLLSRYGMASVDGYTPYSVLTTSKKRAAVVDQLAKERVSYYELAPMHGTVIPISYHLQTVLGDDYVSVANPGLVLTTTTYNYFAKHHHVKTLKLKNHDAALILPVTSIIHDRQYQETGKRPRVKIGEYADLNFNIVKLSNHFPLGQALSFDMAVVVNPSDYAKLSEGIRETYYGFILPKNLSSKAADQIAALDQVQYYHMTDSYLMKYGKGTSKKNPSIFFHNQVYLRQDQQRDMRTAIGLMMFTGVFVSLVFVIAIGELLMLKRLTVAQELEKDYQTLLKIGVGPKRLKRDIIYTQGFIYLLPLVLGFCQSLMVAGVLGIFVNRPSLHLLYLITGVFTLIYAMLYLLTTAFYIRTIHI